MEIDKSIGKWSENKGTVKSTQLDDLAYHLYLQWNLARNKIMPLEFTSINQIKFILLRRTTSPNFLKHKKDYDRFYKEAILLIRKYKVEKIINGDR